MKIKLTIIILLIGTLCYGFNPLYKFDMLDKIEHYYSENEYKIPSEYIITSNQTYTTTANLIDGNIVNWYSTVTINHIISGEQEVTSSIFGLYVRFNFGGNEFTNKDCEIISDMLVEQAKEYYAKNKEKYVGETE